MPWFGAGAATPATAASASSPSGGRRPPWLWCRARCAGIASAVGSRLRCPLPLKRTGVHGRKFTPVYVDDLYTHATTTRKATPARGGGGASVAVTPTTAAPERLGGGAGTTTTAAAGAMRSVMPRRSPGRGLVGVAEEVDMELRADLFIRRVREDLRLQSATERRNRKDVVHCHRCRRRQTQPATASVGGLEEVDLRANLCISKFREDLRRQSQPCPSCCFVVRV